MQNKTTVHEEFETMCEHIREYPSDHSEIVHGMKSRIEAELAKLPRSKAVPYRRRSVPSPPPEEERRVTSRVSASGAEMGGVTAAAKRALAYEEEEEEEGGYTPAYPVYNPKQEATLDRMNMERDVRRYHHILNQAVGIQQTALSHIATIVKELE